MSNVDAALAALGGAAPEVSADPSNVTVPEEILQLARDAALAQDAAQAAAAEAKLAKVAAAELADDLAAAMRDNKIQAIPQTDRDDILLAAYAAKKGKPQSTMKGIIATLEDSHEKTLREGWELIGDRTADDDEFKAAVAQARADGKASGSELWKNLTRPITPAGTKLLIPKPHEVEEPTD